MLVSSANKTYLNLSDTCTISLIYKLNRIGSKTEPCGIPQIISLISCCTVSQTATCLKGDILEINLIHCGYHKVSVSSKNSMVYRIECLSKILKKTRIVNLFYPNLIKYC